MKDFEKSISFYEKFLDTTVTNRCRSGNKFVKFYIDNNCIAKMQPSEYGANADGSTNKEYCKYCLPDGKFSRDITMEEMVESNLKFLKEFNEEGGTDFTAEEARTEMLKYFPTLKRWKNK